MKRKYTKSKMSKRYIYKNKRKYTKKRYAKKKKTRNYSKRIKKGGAYSDSEISGDESELDRQDRAEISKVIARMKLKKQKEEEMQKRTLSPDDSSSGAMERVERASMMADEDTSATAPLPSMKPQDVEIGMLVKTKSGKTGEVMKKVGSRVQVKNESGKNFWREAKDLQLVEDAGSGEVVESQEPIPDESILPVEPQPVPETEDPSHSPEQETEAMDELLSSPVSEQPEPEVEPSDSQSRSEERQSAQYAEELLNSVDKTLDEARLEALIASEQERMAERERVLKNSRSPKVEEQLMRRQHHRLRKHRSSSKQRVAMEKLERLKEEMDEAQATLQAALDEVAQEKVRIREEQAAESLHHQAHPTRSRRPRMRQASTRSEQRRLSEQSRRRSERPQSKPRKVHPKLIENVSKASEAFERAKSLYEGEDSRIKAINAYIKEKRRRSAQAAFKKVQEPEMQEEDDLMSI